MDFSQYINSCDIRDHHRKIGYEYNTLEAAWLVYWCRYITLQEKHEAWQWIIDNMPDQVLDFGRRKNAFQGKSLFRTIADYIEMQKWFINHFTTEASDRIYSFRRCSKSFGEASEDYDFGIVFSDWQKCVDYVLRNIDPVNPGDTCSFRICRSYQNEAVEFFFNGSIEIDLGGRIKDIWLPYGDSRDAVDRYIDLKRFFETLWFEFPTPFQKGDIVCIQPNKRDNPFVLTDILFPSWKNVDEERKRRKEHGGDCSDMIVWGYYMEDSEVPPRNEKDKKAQFIGAYHDYWWHYMDVEYYREDLKGIDRCLKPISAYLKGDLGDDLALLLAAYHRILTEEMYKKTMPLMYTKEGLREAGLMEICKNED